MPKRKHFFFQEGFPYICYISFDIRCAAPPPALKQQQQICRRPTSPSTSLSTASQSWFKIKKNTSNWPIVQRVFWNGSFQKRRLELNWVSPSDRQESDFVGLYRFVAPSAPLFIKTAKFGLRQRFSILLLMVFQECKLDISYFSPAKPCAWKSNHFPNSRTWCSGLVCLQTTMNIQR